jgi:hypothetical protein
MHIRRAQPNDAPAIWRIIGPTIRRGETYTLDRDMPEADAIAYWMGRDRETFVAEDGGEIVGTYFIRAKSGWWRQTYLQLRLHHQQHRDGAGYCSRDVSALHRSCPSMRLSRDAV